MNEVELDPEVEEAIKNASLGFDQTQNMSNNLKVGHSSSYYQGFISRLESIDYNYVSDRVLDVAIQPYNYIVHEVPLS
jgi:hypothetical protein